MSYHVGNAIYIPLCGSGNVEIICDSFIEAFERDYYMTVDFDKDYYAVGRELPWGENMTRWKYALVRKKKVEG